MIYWHLAAVYCQKVGYTTSAFAVNESSVIAPREQKMCDCINWDEVANMDYITSVSQPVSHLAIAKFSSDSLINYNNIGLTRTSGHFTPATQSGCQSRPVNYSKGPKSIGHPRQGPAVSEHLW